MLLWWRKSKRWRAKVTERSPFSSYYIHVVSKAENVGVSFCWSWRDRHDFWHFHWWLMMAQWHATICTVYGIITRASVRTEYLSWWSMSNPRMYWLMMRPSECELVRNTELPWASFFSSRLIRSRFCLKRRIPTTTPAHLTFEIVSTASDTFDTH